MSMELLTVIQFLMTLLTYLFVTLAIPCAVFHKKLCHYRLTERVLLYFIIGNFYATNLVFLLQLLHISNFVTIWICLLVVPAIIRLKLYHVPVLLKLQSLRDTIRKVMAGTLGVKSIFRNLWGKFLQALARFGKRAVKHLCRNWLSWLLVAASAAMVLWIYAPRMITTFGFGASDIPVHLYWTNGLSDNQLFVDGVYPFGMHNLIYLLCTAFRMDSYVLFRVFGMLQCLVVHMVALCVLKLCCKSKFSPYAGIFLYTLGNYIAANNFSRFLSALPQEYSMIFIFPTAYYAFSFFRQKRMELKENEPGKASMLFLSALVMSFSLAVSAHFYGAMVAGIFCVGIAIGYIGWIVRPAYLVRIMVAGLISLAIAVLPMGIAYATGTPLQGSLGWGANMMSGFGGSSSDDDTSTDDTSMGDTSVGDTSTGDTSTGDTSSDGVQTPGDSGTTVETPTEAPPAESGSGFFERTTQKISSFWNILGGRLNSYILRNAEDWYSAVIRWMIVFLMGAGGVLILCRVYSYGAMVLSTGAFMGLMSLMLSASQLGLPALMGADRLCIFYAYMLIMLIGLSIDVFAYAFTCIFRKQWIMQILSFLMILAIGIGVWQQGRIREPLTSGAFETNEAVTCLTNIIATEEDYHWTIFSANDETNMVYGHGYHYELSTFLEEIRRLRNAPITVPTEVIYFFIEKVPLDYAVSYAGSGQSISIAGAERPLPRKDGLGNYQGENRWITMSHMYYWALEFQRLYPNEMKVYLETDKFICYRLEQNTYRLFDLAIDYGYN